MTSGDPELEKVLDVGHVPPEEVLRLAASLDQLSAHVLAESLVRTATERGLRLSVPTGVEEDPGRGVVGLVEGRRVAVGSSAWLETNGYDGARARARDLDDGDAPGRARVLVGVDGRLEGVIVMADHLRPGAETIGPDLRAAGIEHVALVSGDHLEVAREVASSVGIDEVFADQTPEGKLAVVEEARARSRGAVVMAGDGINDAPALALADVGIAMAGKGATVSSETADVVVVVDRADRIPFSIRVGRRSLRIARESVVVGLGLSVGAMVVAAFGYLPPVWGALFQEVIDVAVILNALRALRG